MATLRIRLRLRADGPRLHGGGLLVQAIYEPRLARRMDAYIAHVRPSPVHSFFPRCFSNHASMAGRTTSAFCFRLKAWPAPSMVSSLHATFSFSSAASIFLLWSMGT